MRLYQLDKRSSRRLELDSKPIEDFFNIQPEAQTLWEDIQEWQSKHGLGEFEPQKNVIKKLTELFNVKQNYNVKYEHRNAVWCFQWMEKDNEYNKFVIYQSVGGIQLKLHSDFNETMILPFLKELKLLLIGENESELIAN